jgi:hypothetical protein
MFTRIRWFVYGVVATSAAVVMTVRRAKGLKERLDAKGLRHIAVSYAADTAGAVGRYLKDSVPQDHREGVIPRDSSPRVTG